MIITALVYEGFTMLDLVGPIELLSMLPDADIRIVAKDAGTVWPDNQVLPIIAPFGINDVRSSDILLVPGGPGCAAVMDDPALLEWIVGIDRLTAVTCSVCTGSLILGMAGLLTGKEATSHWSTLNALENFGATPVNRRWVRAGKIVTAAGVSAGIDMALELCRELAGEDVARAAQLALEYDPSPSLDSGDHRNVPQKVKAAVFDGTICFDRRGRSRPVIQR